MTPPTSRRGILAVLSAGAASLLPRRASAAAPGQPVSDAGEGACILTPQAVEGPFYRDPRLVRADIREDRKGVPLRLRLRVIEAGPCTAVAGARVDIWHCDAQGLYSGYPGQGDSGRIDTGGKTFLRGTQDTDEAGWAGFDTIYPGWYPGRATHVHVKVFLDARTLLTGQIYFPDAISEFLYTQVPAYRGRRGERLTVNANDAIALEEDPGRRGFCAVKEERERYLATLVIGIDRSRDARVEESSDGPESRLERPPSIKDRLGALVPGSRRDP